MQRQRSGLERHEVDALDEPVEPERRELLAQVIERVRRQEHGRVLVDVVAQVARVEVVVMEVRDVQVRRVADPLRIDAVVGRERVPRTEERGVEPGIAQDADAAGLDEEPGLAEEGDLHEGKDTGARSRPPEDVRRAVAYHGRSAAQETRPVMSIDYATAGDRLETFGRAWQTFDGDLIVSMFTEDAEYHADLFAPPMVGHNAIRAYWLDGAARPSRSSSRSSAIGSAGDTVLCAWHASFVRAGRRASASAWSGS